MEMSSMGAEGGGVGAGAGAGGGEGGGISGGTQSDEKRDIKGRIADMKKGAEAKLALRHANLSSSRPDPAFLRTLDSSIRRNTAVIKKLKQLNEEQQEGLLDELKAVNLSKFVTEAVAAICEAKVKTAADINAAVQICSLLHQRYKDFSTNLIQGLVKVFSSGGKVQDDSESDKSARALRKRSTLKLLVELYFCGVFDDAGTFVSIIKELCTLDHLRDREVTQTNISLLVSFARQGRVLLGLPLGNQDVQEEIYKELSVTAEQKKLLRKSFQSFYDVAADLLLSDHLALRTMEQENARILNAKGELSEENGAAYEKLRKAYEHLFRNVSSLAEALDIQAPAMPEDGLATTRVAFTENGGAAAAVGKDVVGPEPIWDDEDTRSFYENLPDLRAFVPAVLLGESEAKADAGNVSKPAEKQDARVDSDHVNAAASTSGETESRAGPHKVENQVPDATAVPVDIKSAAAEAPKEEKEESEKAKEGETEKGKEREGEKKVDKDIGEKKVDKDIVEKKVDKDSEREKTKGTDQANLEILLQRLPFCVSRDLIDQLAVDFCYLNSKHNRKKLARTLFNVSRNSLELIPYYSRMAATLVTCMKDLGPMLLTSLEDEFNLMLSKKDQMNVETRIRNIRFIGELVKFKIASPGFVFSCLKACLDDFTHHNIDVACNLLETCGRFLYRSPETSVRMGNMLEIMMRLKNVKNLDARHSTLVDNAYYQCKPPERSARVSKVRPPLHQYIRKLLFSDLDKSSIERVLRQLRKLPWQECELYLLKCFMKVYKGKYSQVHLIASLTAGLSRYHDSFAVAVVDEVLEEIRNGLEVNSASMQQRRIAYMRFLGELYSYRLIDSPVIFDTLYFTIFFGLGTPDQASIDPPEDCFRLRVIITLLETCGHFFDRGSSRRRLDHFLLYFQRYVLSKGSIPLDVEFDLQDLFADLRPKMTRFSTYEEANQALTELEEREANFAFESAGNARRHKGETMADSQAQLSAATDGEARGRDEAAAEALRMDGNGVPGLGDDRDSDSSESESGSMEHEGQDDEEELEDDKYTTGRDDEGDDEEEDQASGAEGVGGSDEEDQVKLKQKKSTEADPAEAEEFERELRALMQESIDSRKLETRARPTLNMMIPMNLFDSKDHGRLTDGESGDEVPDDKDENGVKFKVLVKKGSKQQTKQLHIPRDCSLVQSTKQKEAAELEEKQDIKRLVLEYNEREEEDRSGAASQPLNWSLPSSQNTSSRAVYAKSGWDHGSNRQGNAHQRRPVAAGYGRRR